MTRKPFMHSTRNEPFFSISPACVGLGKTRLPSLPTVQAAAAGVNIFAKW